MSIDLDIYRQTILVFRDAENLRKYFIEQGGNPPECPQFADAALYHCDLDGFFQVALHIPKDALIGHIAHEATHAADILCDYLGLPISCEATEVRAYMVGHIVHELLGEEWD